MPKAELVPPRAASRRSVSAGRWPFALRGSATRRGPDSGFILYFGGVLALALLAAGWAYRFPATSLPIASGGMLVALAALGVCVVTLRNTWQAALHARERDPRQHVALLARGFGVYFMLLHSVIVVATLISACMIITLWGWGRGPLSVTAGLLTIAALASLGVVTAIGKRDLALLGWFCDLSGWPGFSRPLSETWILAARLGAGFSRDATRERSLQLIPRLLRACSTDGQSTQIFSPADTADRVQWANGVPRDIRRRARQELAARLRGSLLPFLWGLLLGWLLLTLLHSVSGWRPPERTHPPFPSSSSPNPPASKSSPGNKPSQPQNKNSSPSENKSGSGNGNKGGSDSQQEGEKGGGGSSAGSSAAGNSQGKGGGSSGKSSQSGDGSGQSGGNGGSSSSGQNSSEGKGSGGQSLSADQSKNQNSGGQSGGSPGSQGAQGSNGSSSQSGAQNPRDAGGQGKQSNAAKGSSGDSRGTGNGDANNDPNTGGQKDSAQSGVSNGGNLPSAVGTGNGKESSGKGADGSPGNNGAPKKAATTGAPPGNDRQSGKGKSGGDARPSSSEANGPSSAKAPDNAPKSGPASSKGSGGAAGSSKADAKQKGPGSGNGPGQPDAGMRVQIGRGSSQTTDGALSPPGALPGGEDIPSSPPPGPRPLDAAQEVVLDFPSETATGGTPDLSGASRAQPGPTPPFGPASSTGKPPPAAKRDSPDSPLQTTPNWIHERLRPSPDRKP